MLLKAIEFGFSFLIPCCQGQVHQNNLMIEDAIRKFAKENFSHKYFPVLHGETDKIRPLALVVKQHRPLWKRPFAKSEIVILADFGRYVKDGAQETVRKTVDANIKDEELSVKQKVDMGASSDEVDVNLGGLAGVTVELCDNQGVLTLGSLSQKYIDDPDLRGILANAELDANKMKAFAKCDELLLITSVIYSEKFELEGERMYQKEIEAEVKNLPTQLQFLSLHRNSPLKFHVRATHFPPGAAARNSQAPFLFKCCYVDYNKETDRLEIRKGEYVGKVLKLRDIDDTCSEEDPEDDDTIIETTDQTDSPDCLTANDIERMENIYRVVLLSEKTTEQRKARVSKYRHWFEKALTANQKELMLDNGMTLEDCDFLRSVYLPCGQNSYFLDLGSLSTDEIQDFAIAFKVLDDLSDEQWREFETSLAADPEY